MKTSFCRGTPQTDESLNQIYELYPISKQLFDICDFLESHVSLTLETSLFRVEDVAGVAAVGIDDPLAHLSRPRVGQHPGPALA